MSLQRSLLETHVEKRYKALLQSCNKLANLVSVLEETCDVFLFGGWVRDCVHQHLHGQTLTWDDIDVVAKGRIDETKLPKTEKNNFGGYRVKLNKTKKIDFWELEVTFAFRQKIFEPSLDNLLRSTVFTVNSIAFDAESFHLKDYLAVHDISRRIVRFNCTAYLDVFPELQVFRAMELVRKFGYELDSEVQAFISDLLKKKSPLEFLNRVLVHKKWASCEDVDRIYAEFGAKF